MYNTFYSTLDTINFYTLFVFYTIINLSKIILILHGTMYFYTIIVTFYPTVIFYSTILASNATINFQYYLPDDFYSILDTISFYSLCPRALKNPRFDAT